MTKNVCIAYGDGIGPEIMKSTVEIMDAMGLDIKYHEIELGEKVFNSGNNSGINKEAWDVLKEFPVLLKAPITTPQGKGHKSLNVTFRKTLGLYANIRRCVSYYPFVQTKHPKMDIVIFRENEEDLYAGIEHRQTSEVYQCLKLASRSGCEKIIRAAFEYAQAFKRKKVTCMSKDNIMKLTDGLFHKVFDEVRKEYADIESEHLIIDIGTARLANRPEDFDVIVCQNLYGDILSDIVAEISGSVGLCGSSNIGKEYAMFEAIHGSAPDIAGKNLANPTGLLMAAIEMLHYIDEPQAATKLHNAILYTLENGHLTGDLTKKGEKSLSTQEFTHKVIEHLGKSPEKLDKVSDIEMKFTFSSKFELKKENKTLDGVDIFIDCDDRNPEALANKLNEAATNEALELVMITNRGVMVWPRYNKATYCTDHWRCRFMPKSKEKGIGAEHIVAIQSALVGADLDIIKTENLYTFNGERGYSLGQGQ